MTQFVMILRSQVMTWRCLTMTEASRQLRKLAGRTHTHARSFSQYSVPESHFGLANVSLGSSIRLSSLDIIVNRHHFC